MQAIDPAFLDVLNQRQRFLLSGHEHPDGDCVGAQAAMHHLLVQMGKEPRILNPDPMGRAHDFLCRETPFAAYDAVGLPEHDVAILLDCAQLSRLNDLGRALADNGSEIAVVDHHVGSEHGDGRVCYVDSSAPSTGTMVYRLFRHFDQPIPRPAAEGIFLSLVSDTGWFRYSNTTTEVHRVAAEMIDLGVEPAVMYDAIHRRNHVGSVSLFADLLRRHGVEKDGRYGWVVLDKAAMDRASKIAFETDSVLEVLRSVEGIEVVGMFKERFDGGVKLSLRASGDVDVCAIAKQFGGGGHKKAAGATMAVSLDEAREQVARAVGAALEQSS